MANLKSAEKRNRQAQKRRARNAAVRTQVRNVLKKAREAIATKDPQKSKEGLQQAMRALDKAASKGVLHARNAARRIARLAATAAQAKK
ncbi:MAG TPA: 30S ribosomal protein S20 [Myxococcaceae bacterium]|jgi:small subunit ribosomal protein S20